MLWRLEPLTVDEFEAVWKLTRGNFVGVDFQDPKQGLGDWVDLALEKRILPKLVAIVLKPHEPTPLHRWWNRWQAWRTGFDRENMGSLISASPVFAEVLRDFFLLNVGWIDGWLSTRPNYRSNGRDLATPGETLSTLMNLVSSFAAATSEMRSRLEGSPPKPS